MSERPSVHDPPRTRARRIVEKRSREIEATAAEAFAPIRRIGGDTGWYAYDGLWRVRGWLDRLLGGVGARRGRRDPEALRVGDAIDAWRVEAFEPDRLLRLRAETRLPGRAWLELAVERGDADGGSGDGQECVTLTQTVLFEPAGLAGLVYWHGVQPLHAAVFRGMLDGIARAATEERDRARARAGAQS